MAFQPLTDHTLVFGGNKAFWKPRSKQRDYSYMIQKENEQK